MNFKLKSNLELALLGQICQLRKGNTKGKPRLSFGDNV